MKIKQLSDLHLEHHKPGEYFHPGEGDVLILAGDIIKYHHLKTNGYFHDIYSNFFNKCSENFEHVIYVLGNHEFYSGLYDKAKSIIQPYVPKNFYILNDETVKIQDINFIGFTLWTDYFNENPLQMWDCQQRLNDYKAIRIGANYRKFRVNDALAFHRKSLNYLKTQLYLLKDKRVFVISHHSPTLQSIPEKFKTSIVNGGYCSDLDGLIIENSNILNWAFGHIHYAQDFYIEQCRMTCNPKGYPGETTGFDINFTIKI